jgi:hypothetical protein
LLYFCPTGWVKCCSKAYWTRAKGVSALYKMKWTERENNNIENIISNHGVVLFVRSSLYAL